MKYIEIKKSKLIDWIIKKIIISKREYTCMCFTARLPLWYCVIDNNNGLRLIQKDL